MPILDFPSKDLIYGHHLTVPYRTIEAHKNKSVGSGDLDNNLIIHGDNLDALKALMPRYAGKVNCIYIDPPYNTGNQNWIYNDNVNSPTMKRWLKDKKPVDNEDTERHDKWLCMMLPRLQLMKELLAQNGVIFVSIDDNEQANLKLLMDEVFGEENFLAQLVWRKKPGGGMDSKDYVREHEYIICYKKSDKFSMIFREVEVLEKGFTKIVDGRRYRLQKLESRGDNQFKKDRPSLFYSVKDPDGNDCYPKAVDGTDGTWREHLNKIDEDHREWIKKNERWQLYKKVYFDESPKTKVAKDRTIFYSSEEFGSNATATVELFKILGNRNFDWSKPSRLIKRLLKVTVPPKDGIVLDSFSGSGTTAQAVLELNKQDGGNRKFILVECEHYVDEITAERVRRVIKGIPNAKDENLKNGLGGEFTFCTLGEELKESSLLEGKRLPTFEALARHLFYNATGKSLPTSKTKKTHPYFVASGEERNFYLIYKPDLEFLRSKESALSEDILEGINKHKGPNKEAIVYSTSKFLRHKDLSKHRVTWCQLPFTLYGSPVNKPPATELEKQAKK